MVFETLMAKLLGLDEASWARAANPRSGWLWFTVLPLLALAGISRVWIGWAFLLPLAAALAWAWRCPRAFAPPERWNAWMTRGVLGARLWLDRRQKPIPRRHTAVPGILLGLLTGGTGLALYGVLALSRWPVLAGIAIASIARLWFTDRMTWLHNDMKEGSR